MFVMSLEHDLEAGISLHFHNILFLKKYLNTYLDFNKYLHPAI